MNTDFLSFKEPGIGLMFLFSTIQLVIYWLIVLMFELKNNNRKLHKFITKYKNKSKLYPSFDRVSEYLKMNEYLKIEKLIDLLFK